MRSAVPAPGVLACGGGRERGQAGSIPGWREHPGSSGIKARSLAVAGGTMSELPHMPECRAGI